MVRGRSDKRSEGGVWEGAALNIVNKNTVEACKGGVLVLVTPSVEPIKQREFNDGKFVDCVVKERAKGVVHVARVFISRITDQVKIPGKDPSSFNVRAQFQQVLQEDLGITVIRGSINVSDRELVLGFGGGKSCG